MNDRQWYYAEGNVQQGPVAESELVQMFSTGELQSDILVWTEGMEGWEAAATVAGLVTSGYGIDPETGVSYIVAPTVLKYAGFWKRFAAVIIDGIILQILGTIITTVAGRIFMSILTHAGMEDVVAIFVNAFLLFLVYVVIDCFYYTGLESSPKQATIGKMALGIKVTDLNGQRISFSRANGRYWGKILSMLPFCIGFMMAGFTEKKQALHDMLAGTLVVNK